MRAFGVVTVDYWKRCFGSGHTLLGTRADWREHMARSAVELGVQGLRMHGVMVRTVEPSSHQRGRSAHGDCPFDSVAVPMQDDDLSVMPRKGEYHFYSIDVSWAH